MSKETPFPSDPAQDFMLCIRTNATVRQAASHGISMERCIMALCSHLEEAQNRILELDSCAPKVLLQGGKRFVWRCPDELIPKSQHFTV